MEILLAIDDTDNLESIGTGALLQNLCAELLEAGLAKCDFVTRHQLLVHEDIAYTSHNSCMCCRAEVEKENLAAVIRFSQEYLENNLADGSDPGLCVTRIKQSEDYKDLMEFGLAAQNRVLQKVDAYNMAERYRDIMFLSEHGGTGDGVIGAVAGCGLRLSGMDGKIKAKIKPEDPDVVITVSEFCRKFNISWAIDEHFQEISHEETVVCGDSIKLFLWKNEYSVILAPDGVVADWHPMKKRKDKQ